MTSPPPIPDKTVATPRPAMGTVHAAGGAPVDCESLVPGDIIDNKYEVVRVLGRGGMGLVLEAIHLQLREPVALKFMNAATLANPEAGSRFTREARAAARLKGEHICRVLDMGQTPEGDRYIVIEYLDGQDLAQVLRQRGPLPYAEVVDYILQACEAMAEAHSAGIIHRDLKPANLFLTTGTDGNPSIKVLDFGISKLMDPTVSAVVTTTRSLMGSPLYMAPEQLVSARDVDPRSDIWALATVLYRLVSGRTPFVAETLPEIVAQVLHTDPPPLSSVVPDVPPELDAAIERALAKKPEDRYPSVAAFAGDLAAVLPESSHRATRSAAVLMRPRRPTTASGTNPPPLSGSNPSGLEDVSMLRTLDEIIGEPPSSLEVSLEVDFEPDKAASRPRRSPLRHLRWAALLLAAAAAGLWYFHFRGGDSPAPPASPPVESAAAAPTDDVDSAPEPEPELVFEEDLADGAGTDVDVDVDRPARSKRPARRKARRSKARARNKNKKAKASKDTGSDDLLEPGAVKARTPRPEPKKKNRAKKNEAKKKPAPIEGPELLD